LVEQGFRGKTMPFLWTSKIFGPLFERNVPMDPLSRRDLKGVTLAVMFLLPVLIVAIVLASPFEWLRGRRAELHNARMKKRLLAGGTAPGGGDPDAGLGGRVVVDYRIEREGRAVFFGVALVVLSAESKELLGFTVHRDVPPRRAIDGEAIRKALVASGTVVTELCYWQWNLRDPYELTERPARPW
jgi:hypothetical protein